MGTAELCAEMCAALCRCFQKKIDRMADSVYTGQVLLYLVAEARVGDSHSFVLKRVLYFIPEEMSRMRIAQTVREITEPLIEQLGMELIDVEYVKEGTKWFLRLYIDKPGGISLDDCQLVSEQVGEAIDRADPIQGAYIFEVSSPGLDRPLKTDRDFIRYQGEYTEVGLYAPRDGRKQFFGNLVGRQDGRIIIETEDGVRSEFEEKDVSVVKRAIKW